MTLPSGSKKGRSVWLGKTPPDHLIQHQAEVRFPVRADTAGMRLDLFLHMRLPWRSREGVHRLLREREILVSGVRRKASYRLKEGEEVVVPTPPPGEDPAVMHGVRLHIIHEDEHVVVLNKQPDVVVHPVGRHRYGTLINALHLRYRRPDDPAGDVQPKLGHRLDKETSGVLVVCKSDAARQSVSRQFERGLVRKEYLALVEGRPVPAKGTVDAPLGRALGARVALAQAVRPDGLPALTRYEELDHGAAFALVRAMPETGRQHQVRVHLAHVGCPILCDKLYGRRSALRLAEVRPLRPGEEDGLLLSRHALHAHRITLAHPATGEPLTLEAPLPEDMASVIRAWGGRWPLADHAT